jgi:hypothetical protein
MMGNLWIRVGGGKSMSRSLRAARALCAAQHQGRTLLPSRGMIDLITKLN